jgi:hypothetical protein
MTDSTSGKKHDWQHFLGKKNIIGSKFWGGNMSDSKFCETNIIGSNLCGKNMIGSIFWEKHNWQHIL